MLKIVRYANDNIPFYREFYRQKRFTIDKLRSLEDWERIPIVTKADLQNFPLAARTARRERGYKINTGGTSGQPLEFYLDRQAFAREWAHMHFIWKSRGYHPYDLKLTFRGKRLEGLRPIQYNAVHNEFVVNANAPMPQVAEAVMALPPSVTIRWLHGYPSLVAEFGHTVSALPCFDLAKFRSRLFGILLGSEFPAPTYREVIEKVFSSNIVSWYGHSEMAVLARETAQGTYATLPTYGIAEAVRGDSGCHRLVCTSLHNRCHPFIRYDTGDLIRPLSQREGVLEFQITEGRIGDFIHDKNGQRHSLTAIIFGRHHAAFELLQHLQVREDSPGRITLLVTPRHPNVHHSALRKGFDLDDLQIEWQVAVVPAPVRTGAGKIQLKIT